MLTAKENLIECIEGGKPDRFVNQYEAVRFFFSPWFMFHGNPPAPGAGEKVDPWGVTTIFPEGAPGPFPVHTPDKIVVQDIEEWDEYVKKPCTKFPEAEWEIAMKIWEEDDGTRCFKAPFVAPGVFELTHYLCSITEVLVYYITNPDEMHDMIKLITEFELEIAEGICDHFHPEALFHHDDWGSQQNSFLRPEMFEEFFLPAYKEIYGYYKSRGVKYVFHHNDAYSANLIPTMIEMGIDVWQGPMQSNNIPEIVEKYQGQITFMGGIDNALCDFEGWTEEDVKKAALIGTDGLPLTGYIPCITQGGPGSVFPGVYDKLTEEIERINYEKFGFTPEEQRAVRAEIPALF